jgi:hypothetical protein
VLDVRPFGMGHVAHQYGGGCYDRGGVLVAEVEPFTVDAVGGEPLVQIAL